MGLAETKKPYHGGVYRDYDDWYDNGPGSEAFKRSCRGKPLKTFPDLTPSNKVQVLTEKSYRSAGRGVNEDHDMMQITINISINQWRAFKHKFIRLLHKVRMGGMF